MADYNNNGGGQMQERRKSALDNKKLTLQALDKNADGKYASWVWGFKKNDVTITIWTNEEADKNSKHKGRIEAVIPLPLAFYLIEQINLAAESEGEYTHRINLKDFKFFGQGKRSDEPMLLSQVFVGKSADGVVWISVTAPERPRYRFGFVPRTGYAELVDAAGNPAAPGLVSKIYAKGYAKLLTQVYALYAYHDYQEPPKKPQNGNGGGGYGGGNNNRQGGYGGGNQGGGVPNYETVDNDVPY